MSDAVARKYIEFNRVATVYGGGAMDGLRYNTGKSLCYDKATSPVAP